MKIKTSELKGAALDYAVSLTQGFEYGPPRKCHLQWHYPLSRPDWSTIGVAALTSKREWSANVPKYSSDWSQGGPLIETYKVDLYWHDEYNGGAGMWEAHCGSEFVLADTPDTIGKSPLVAACRAIVMAKLGEEVEIPDELCDESK